MRNGRRPLLAILDLLRERVSSLNLHIQWLRQVNDDALPVWLVLDSHSVHSMGSVKGSAEEMGTHLTFAPPAAADELQPLDRTVFGTTKVACRWLFWKLITEDPMMDINRQTPVRFLIRPSEQVGPSKTNARTAIVPRR
jgi:hypothetical protein